ncbi:RNA-directed DNA polymerase, eukaryota [Tanacetum coccineum]
MAADHHQNGLNNRRPRVSNADLTSKISHSIYVTNFPDSVNSRDLWKECSVYGTVVDVFIPTKLSKVGKRFAFVRFIKFGSPKVNGDAVSFVAAAKGVANSLISPSPALVLDDECIKVRDFSNCAMGKIKDLNSILNLQDILVDEGFEDVKLFYLGGRWVMFECSKVETKQNLLKHIGFNSWFHEIKEVPHDFVCEERVVWVDIEGIPLHAWSRETFTKIGKKWGEMLDLEDSSNSSFGRKRLCILTNHPSSILETFKIIVKSRVFMVRAKELFMWNPSFQVLKEKDYVSDNDSLRGEKINDMQIHSSDDEEEEEDGTASEVQRVAESVFGDNSVASSKHKSPADDQQSADPFKIYDLLKKPAVELKDPCQSLSHPPGFTPLVSEVGNHPNEENGDNMNNEVSPRISTKVMNKSQQVQEEISYNSVGQSKASKGGSVLGVLEEVIKVGQAMGYSMEGCEKDVETIIGNQGDDIGGILCIWEKSIFKKEDVTISDYFVAIYGTWIPNKVKILFVAIYAPQDPKYRRILWDYISILISRWNGEVILMGDFNEVRSSNERRGSCFNSCNARFFDNFISSSSLVDVKMEGYSFTWSHPSANKMSKLDRFLVSDGVIDLFPSITAFCLDRHLSDHRPILLCEVKLDFGPVPFRMYHSWFNFVGFDDMVVQTWSSLSFSDRNGMVRFKKKLQELKKIMRVWIKDKNNHLANTKRNISDELHHIDKTLDAGGLSDSLLLRRNDLKGQLHDIKSMEVMDM